MKEMIKKVFMSKKRRTITGIGLVTVLVISTVSINANAAMKVNSCKAQMGELSSSLELNGKVESDFEKTYFSQVDGVIGTILVKEGDFVKKGDVIMNYDAGDIERQISK